MISFRYILSQASPQTLRRFSEVMYKIPSDFDQCIKWLLTHGMSLDSFICNLETANNNPGNRVETNILYWLSVRIPSQIRNLIIRYCMLTPRGHEICKGETVAFGIDLDPFSVETLCEMGLLCSKDNRIWMPTIVFDTFSDFSYYIYP